MHDPGELVAALAVGADTIMDLSTGGDLDAILLRALQTRPEARYESVAAMRDDLRRHLSGHPVSARGDAALYRARRFVRRHRAPVATAAGAFLMLEDAATAAARGATVLADLDTPLSVYLKLADGPDAYLLESVEGGETWGRFSIIQS